MIQDMGERHILIRPIESISHANFFNMMQTTMDRVTDFAFWDINFEQYIATRVENA
jgi:hypothetical protein